jgi:hypothetical protein
MKKVVFTVLKILALVIVYFIVSAVFGVLLPLSHNMMEELSVEEQPLFMPLYLFNILINMSVVMLIMTKLRYTGWKLFGAGFISFYGLFMVVNQMEIIWFNKAFPLYTYGDVGKVLLTTLVAYAAVALLATFFVNGFKRPEAEHLARFDIGRSGWKILLFLVLYPPFYYFCGFIAWSFAAARELYAGWAATMGSTWIMLLFNVLRGGLWLLFSVPLLLGFTSRKQAFWLMPLMLVTATALEFITPNPAFPPMARVAHMLELGLSMAVVGMFMVMLFLRDKNPAMLK